MEKKWASIALIVVLTFVSGLMMTEHVTANSMPVLEIVPQATEVDVNENFTIDINMTALARGFGFEFVLEYDPSILELVSVTTAFPTVVRINEEYTGLPTIHAGYDCDVVPDYVLNVGDIVATGAAFGSEPGDPGWNPRADITKDGIVDIDDFAWCLLALESTAVSKIGVIQFMDYLLEAPWEGGRYATVSFESKAYGESLLDLDKITLCNGGGGSIPYEANDGLAIVSVEKGIQNEITLVETIGLPTGTENTLASKLDAAITLLNQDNLNGAVHKLEDFIKNVEALRNKKLTDAQADVLVASTQAIIDAII